MSDNGLPITDEQLLAYSTSWLITDSGHSQYTHDLMAMLSERVADLLEERARLATPASAPVGETTEHALREAGAQAMIDMISDLYPGHFPRMDLDALFRAMQDKYGSPAYMVTLAARAAERRDQEEGR